MRFLFTEPGTAGARAVIAAVDVRAATPQQRVRLLLVTDACDFYAVAAAARDCDSTTRTPRATTIYRQRREQALPNNAADVAATLSPPLAPCRRRRDRYFAAACRAALPTSPTSSAPLTPPPLRAPQRMSSFRRLRARPLPVTAAARENCTITRSPLTVAAAVRDYCSPSTCVTATP